MLSFVNGLSKCLQFANDDILDMADLKHYLRVDYDEDDKLLKRLVKVAIYKLENYIGRAIVKQKWETICEISSDKQLVFPREPLAAVEMISWIDNDGTVLEPINYRIAKNAVFILSTVITERLLAVYWLGVAQHYSELDPEITQILYEMVGDFYDGRSLHQTLSKYEHLRLFKV